MEALFLKLVNMSLTASWLVLAVVIARFVLKKAPCSLRCLLWGFVGLRLILPFSIESALSLVPSSEPLPQEFLYAAAPQLDTGIPVVNRVLNPVIAESLAPAPLTSANPTQIWSLILSHVWLFGMALMVLYALVSFLLIRRRVRVSMPLAKGIRVCDQIDTPFILGIVRPVIYLPSSLDAGTQAMVLAHENAHLKRKDHWWKPLGFALLSVYWFNPVIWLAYILLCRDIELACDERVVRDMDTAEKMTYSSALLSCSVPRRLISACPLAFGEIGVKDRIKSVLNYKKPAFWVVIGALAACIAVGVCFLTDPENADSGAWEAQCREVLDQIQSKQTYHITAERRFVGTHVLNDSSAAEYYGAGDTRLHMGYIPADGSTHGLIVHDGICYESTSYDGTFSWQEPAYPDPEAASPWILLFDWNAQTVDAIARQASADFYYIRLKVFSPIDMGHLSCDNYHVDFYFDNQDNFLHAERLTNMSGTDLSGEPMSETITEVIFINDTPEETVMQTIGQVFHSEAVYQPRLAVGRYDVSACLYWPESSTVKAYFGSYDVTESSFIPTNSEETQAIHSIHWKWEPVTDDSPALTFYAKWYADTQSKPHRDIPELTEGSLYQKLEDGKFILQKDGALYYILGADRADPSKNVDAIFLLKPQVSLSDNALVREYPEAIAQTWAGGRSNSNSVLVSDSTFVTYRSMDALETAIYTAVMDHNVPKNWGNAVYLESHVLLSELLKCGINANGESIGYTKVCAVAMISQVLALDGQIQILSEKTIPVVIDFLEDEDHKFTVLEYWQPEETEDPISAIQSRFPSIALYSAQAYLTSRENKELEEQIENQALYYFDLFPRPSLEEMLTTLSKDRPEISISFHQESNAAGKLAFNAWNTSNCAAYINQLLEYTYYSAEATHDEIWKNETYYALYCGDWFLLFTEEHVLLWYRNNVSAYKAVPKDADTIPINALISNWYEEAKEENPAS